MSADDKNEVKHVYDGIEEQDNVMPNWWLGILFGTIVFAFAYWAYFEVWKAGAQPDEEYALDLAELEKKRPKQGPLDDQALAALAGDETLFRGGKEVFNANCVACHGPEGGGVIGPNLTDKFWLHGGRPSDIQKIIAAGVLEKGMPSWEPTLGPERVKQLTAFVLSIRGRNVEGGKGPQGEPVQ
jgi:cytochrome c oxidase cbb3-type subunit III